MKLTRPDPGRLASGRRDLRLRRLPTGRVRPGRAGPGQRLPTSPSSCCSGPGGSNLKPRTRARRPGLGTARDRAALPRSWARPARGLALVESPSALDCSAASPQVSFCATPRGRVHGQLPRAVPRCVLAAHARKGILPACRDCLATTAAKTAPVLADRCMPMADLSRCCGRIRPFRLSVSAAQRR
jgi:hypothetical protein